MILFSHVSCYDLFQIAMCMEDGGFKGSDATGNYLILKNSNGEEVSIDLVQVKKAAIVLRILSHTIKKGILILLSREPNLTVTSIYQKMNLEQSLVSQHLAALRRAGIVTASRQGKHTRYDINTGRLLQLYLHATRMLE